MRVRSDLCGFTLVEIILTLVILGLVGMVGVSFFNSGVTRTDVAINQLQADAKLQLVLENMIQDASNKFSNNLSGLYSNIGAVGEACNTYGYAGNNTNISYYVATKQYVCPNATTKTFETVISSNQFLMVTIKPNASSGVSLSYVFSNSSANNSANSNACGS